MSEAILGERQWRHYLIRWLSVSLVLHLITAYFSVGYQSADEHFQILEFLGFKLGITPREVLAIEYSEKMRPWFQPALYAVWLKLCMSLGVESPFSWVFSIRVLTGLIGWLSGCALALSARRWLKDVKAQKQAVLGVTFMWFMPALHVRPSSESLSGSLGVLAICLLSYLHDRSKEHKLRAKRLWIWFFCGALFGLSFEARFQMALMWVGALGWLAFQWRGQGRQARKETSKNLAVLILGFIAIFILGRWVDHWGYGEWVLSPWNYFSYNLVRGEVGRYGQAPWWDIFRMSFTETWPFLGTTLVFASLFAWLKYPRHLLTWCQIPFFLVHEIIAHKELRFFYPIALAGPILMAQGWVTGLRPGIQKIARAIWIFLVVNNFIALAVLTVVPFSRVVQFYEGLYDLIPPGATQFELYAGDRDPYEVLGTSIYFYRPKALIVRRFTSYEDLDLVLAKKPQGFWLFHPRFRLEGVAAQMAPHCEPRFRTLPPWIERLDWGGWLARTNAWTLYYCVR